MASRAGVSASLENRVTEFVDHLNEHFVDPARLANGHYLPPENPGYSADSSGDSMRKSVLEWSGLE